jgi:hypothetical protein
MTESEMKKLGEMGKERQALEEEKNVGEIRKKYFVQ